MSSWCHRPPPPSWCPWPRVSSASSSRPFPPAGDAPPTRTSDARGCSSYLKPMTDPAGAAILMVYWWNIYICIYIYGIHAIFVLAYILTYANNIVFFVDGIHGTPYIAAPWILWFFQRRGGKVLIARWRKSFLRWDDIRYGSVEYMIIYDMQIY